MRRLDAKEMNLAIKDLGEYGLEKAHFDQQIEADTNWFFTPEHRLALLEATIHHGRPLKDSLVMNKNEIEHYLKLRNGRTGRFFSEVRQHRAVVLGVSIGELRTLTPEEKHPGIMPVTSPLGR